MKKYICFVMGVMCLLLSPTVYAEDLKSTDANIVGHVIEKKTLASICLTCLFR